MVYNVAAFSTHLNDIVNGRKSIWTNWRRRYYIGNKDFWMLEQKNMNLIWKNIIDSGDILKIHIAGYF